MHDVNAKCEKPNCCASDIHDGINLPDLMERYCVFGHPMHTRLSRCKTSVDLLGHRFNCGGEVRGAHDI